jgi:hypothetical protein
VNRGVVVLLVAAGTRVATAQANASLGLGVGTVRYPGGSSFSSTAFSPTLRWTAPTVVADFSGSLASLPDAVWSSQGRADVWGATSLLRDGLQLGAEGIVAATSLNGVGSTAATHAVLEVLRSARVWGFGMGAGPSAGWIGDGRPVVALHARARAWWRPGGVAGGTDWQASVEPTQFQGAWFTDVSGGVALQRGRAMVSLWTAARVSAAYGSSAAGSASLQLSLAPAVSLELSGGSYLSDPYQGLPQAGFVTVGLRLHGPPRARRDPPVPKWAPLVPETRGDSLVVRFRMENARSVAIAGDWNAWQPVPLRPAGGDVWEGALLLGRGLYHFNLLVDEGDWVVPNGVASVPDGLGGMVAVLIVP